MRHLMRVLTLGLILGTASAALAQPYTTPPMLKPIGYETMTVGAAAKGLTASQIAPADWRRNGKATLVFLSVESNDIRVCLDGTAASATNCHVLAADGAMLVYSTEALTQMQMYAGGGNATVKVTYFRAVGK